MIVTASLILLRHLMHVILNRTLKDKYMKKLIFTLSLFTTFLVSELDIGEDFAPGDLVTAEIFNTKFGKLKKTSGEIYDSELIGEWGCTSYKESSTYIDDDYKIENGGNGQVGEGHFYSNSGVLTFSELDEESSLTSPKQFSIDRYDVLSDGDLDGTYSLLLNKIYFFHEINGETRYMYHSIVKFLDENKISLEWTQRGSSFGDVRPNTAVICEKSEES